MSVSNPSLGLLFVLLGGLAILAGFWKTPIVTIEERDGGGGETIRISKVEDLPGMRHVVPNDMTVADLAEDPKKYSGQRVRVRGKIKEWLRKDGGEEYMRFTLESANSTIKV